MCNHTFLFLPILGFRRKNLAEKQKNRKNLAVRKNSIPGGAKYKLSRRSFCLESIMRRQLIRNFSKSSGGIRTAVVVDGGRIPFTKAGTLYSKYLAVDLQRFAFICVVLHSSAIFPLQTTRKSSMHVCQIASKQSKPQARGGPRTPLKHQFFR